MLKPIRDAVRKRFLSRRIQRSVPLKPEDRKPKRKRKHVLVDLIYEQCPPSGLTVVEVGIKTGKTGAHVLRYCPQIEKMYGVDLVEPDPWRNHMSKSEKMELLLGDSAEIASRFDDDSIDLVFLDADHAYESVRNDLHAWVPKVKPGGVIVGHDYGARHHPGVEKAVKEFFEGHSHPIRLDANKVWWTLKAP